MATKAQLIEQIRELHSDMADHLVAEKANKATIEAALEDLLEAQPDDEQSTGAMAALRRYRHKYVTLQRQDGGKSLGCGDPVQEALLAFGPADLKQLAATADKLLGHCPANKRRPEQSHWDRYSGLNNGQIRMNIGNRLRAAVKKGSLVVTDKGQFKAA